MRSIGGVVIISRKIKGMVIKNASGDKSRNQEKNNTRKKNHKQKDKVSAETVKVMTERPEFRPKNGRSAGGSRTLPSLFTQLPTGTPNRNDWRSQHSSFSSRTRSLRPNGFEHVTLDQEAPTLLHQAGVHAIRPTTEFIQELDVISTTLFNNRINHCSSQENDSI